MEDSEKAAAAERKRKRLEAWRKRQEEKAKAAESEKEKPKITMSIGANTLPKKKKKKKKQRIGFGSLDEDDTTKEEKKSLELLDISDMKSKSTDEKTQMEGNSPPKKKRRWGASSKDVSTGVSGDNRDGIQGGEDDLDKFMDNLKAGAMGEVVIQTKEGILSVDVSGSMMRQEASKPTPTATDLLVPSSGGVITPEELAKLSGTKEKSSRKPDDAYYGPSDWETSASEVSYNVTILSFLLKILGKSNFFIYSTG